MPNVSIPKKVLIAPLDWGLGHATRCIPVINEFLNQGCEVQVASSGAPLILLKEEFSSLKFHSLVPYNAKYSASLPFLLKILLQVPKFVATVRKEHRQLEKIVHDEKIDLVISDNRYGCWSQKVKSIFICHQLILKAPFSYVIAGLYEKAIKRFSECWVPDEEGKDSLAGELAMNTRLKPKYIGVLSRMKWRHSQTRYEIMVILSGPEPQRSIFEKIIFKELKDSNKKCLVVRGLPGEKERSVRGSLEYVSHLNAQEMNSAILESELIISRSGYSTIMDLTVLGKRAIFVPTSGQTEQEYLAKELMKKKIAFSMTQDNFNLQQALSHSKGYSGFGLRNENVELNKAVKRLLDENY